jgi:hypothetical protein
MFCNKCGCEMTEGSAFCPKCGAEAAKTKATKKEERAGGVVVTGYDEEYDNDKFMSGKFIVACVVLLVAGLLFVCFGIGDVGFSTSKGSSTSYTQDPKKAEEPVTAKACISSWDGQHIRMKREIEKEFKGPKHLYTGMNKPKAKTGETVQMWTCFAVPDRNNRMVKSQVYYKTIVPASKTVNTNDPNWCPVFDVEIVRGCE